MGLGIDGNDAKIIKSCEEDLSKIAGQMPVKTKFKKSYLLKIRSDFLKITIK